MKLISYLFIIFLTCASTCVQGACNDLHGQIYPQLELKSGTVCFVREPVRDPKTGEAISAEEISLYYISQGAAPVKSEGRGLIYDDTSGEIIDAFVLMVGRDQREEVFVIHSIEIRGSLVELNSSGKFYSVSVFEVLGSNLRRDERASEWFGADYSWLSDGGKIVYRYPYKSRIDVQGAMRSPFATLMSTDAIIHVKLKNKKYLFEDANVRSKTKKYLVNGDRATVEKVTAGWCRINYSGVAKPLEMWVECDGLDANMEETGRALRQNAYLDVLENHAL